MHECNGLNTSISCNSNGITEIDSVNTTSGSKEVEFTVAPGANIKVDGVTIYENTGGEIKKAKMRVPGA